MSNNGDEAISPLVAALISKNAQDLAATTDALIDSLTQEKNNLAARIALIRESINDLCSGPYMPHPNRIIEALYPSEHFVRVWVEDHRDEL